MNERGFWMDAIGMYWLTVLNHTLVILITYVVLYTVDRYALPKKRNLANLGCYVFLPTTLFYIIIYSSFGTNAHQTFSNLRKIHCVSVSIIFFNELSLFINSFSRFIE